MIVRILPPQYLHFSRFPRFHNYLLSKRTMVKRGLLWSIVILRLNMKATIRKARSNISSP